MEQNDKLALLQAQQHATFDTLEKVYLQVQNLESELRTLKALNNGLQSEKQRLEALLQRSLWQKFKSCFPEVIKRKLRLSG